MEENNFLLYDTVIDEILMISNIETVARHLRLTYADFNHQLANELFTEEFEDYKESISKRKDNLVIIKLDESFYYLMDEDNVSSYVDARRFLDENIEFKKLALGGKTWTCQN